MRQIVIFIGILLMFAGQTFTSCVNAQSGYAGMPGSYLHMGVGARALGMGKAYTALASDPTAIYWNPAGLAAQDPYQIYAMHSTLFFDTNFDYVAASAPTKRFGSFGLGIIALTSSGFEQRSVLNEELGKFGMMDMAFLFNWSTDAYFGVSVGVNYKLVTQKMLEFSGVGHGLDIGLKAKLFDRFDTGLVFVNIINPSVSLASEAQKFPAQIRFGVASPFLNDKLSVSSEITKILGWGSTQLNIGIEYRVLSNIAVRAGLNNGHFTIGSGISFNNYGIDYGNASISELGVNHRFAVKYEFGGFSVRADASPEIFSPAGEQNISKIKLHVKTRSAVSKWILEIKNSGGVIVRKFSQSGNIPEYIVWDGKNNAGALVPDGKFNYHFEVITANGKNLYTDGSLVSVDSRGPIGTLGLNDEK